MAMNTDQALAILSAHSRHWTLQREQIEGGDGYCVTVLAGVRGSGRRIRVYRRSMIDALNAAIAELEGRGAKPKHLRLAR
jgi:hypothetical protein